MKVVVVGTNQKDRERVAKAIKDKYGGLAEMNEGLRNNKRYLENDLALKMEEIADLKTAVKVFQDDTTMRKAHIKHLEGQIVALSLLLSGARNANALLKTEITVLIAENDRLKKLCAELVGDDMKKEIE